MPRKELPTEWIDRKFPTSVSVLEKRFETPWTFPFQWGILQSSGLEFRGDFNSSNDWLNEWYLRFESLFASMSVLGPYVKSTTLHNQKINVSYELSYFWWYLNQGQIFCISCGIYFRTLDRSVYLGTWYLREGKQFLIHMSDSVT